MKRLPDRDERRALVLRAGSRQVLWALLLTLIILAGLAFRLGREVGYAISFGVCGGIAVLTAASLLAIRIADRATSGIVSCLRPRESPSTGDRGSPGRMDRS